MFTLLEIFCIKSLNFNQWIFCSHYQKFFFICFKKGIESSISVTFPRVSWKHYQVLQWKVYVKLWLTCNLLESCSWKGVMFSFYLWDSFHLLFDNIRYFYYIIFFHRERIDFKILTILYFYWYSCIFITTINPNGIL